MIICRAFIRVSHKSMKFIFWNINNNPEAIELINSIDFYRERTVFAIAEFWDIEDTLSKLSSSKKFLDDGVPRRTGVIYSNSLKLMPVFAEKYFSSYEIRYNDANILLIVVHLKSMRPSESAAKSLNLNIIRRIIEGRVQKFDGDKIIIVGDFNLISYNAATDFFHLNSTDYYSPSEREYKIYEDEKRLKYYSPIQSFSGDLSAGPPGTYHYVRSEYSQSWYSLDNFFVSYPLAKYLDKEQCKVMSNLNGHCLLKNNRPDKRLSDHLPIKIELL